MSRPAPPNCYWVVPETLLAGAYPLDEFEAEAALLQQLLEVGIDTFIDLTEPGERPAYRAQLPSSVAYVRHPMPDGSIGTVAQMHALQQQLRDALENGRRVYVHCRAGIGRTGTVIGCHLVEQGLDGASALRRLNRLWQRCTRHATWPNVPQTREQVDFILSWAPQRAAVDEAATLARLGALRERYLGCLLGLATGDALGITTQYQRPGGAGLTDLIGGGPFDLPRGSWSDDTALALCVADSLLACEGFDTADQLVRFERWRREGARSATGECIGITAGTARRLQRGVGSLEVEAAPLSRTAPIVLYGLAEPGLSVERSGLAARAMGASPRVADACRLLAAMLVQALRGAALEGVLSPPEALFAGAGLEPAVHMLLDASPSPPAFPGVAAGEPALLALATVRWALRAESFRAGALRVANLGADADVATAVYGAVAGAQRGLLAIPPGWLASLAQRTTLEELADRLLTAALVGLSRSGDAVADSRPAIG